METESVSLVSQTCSALVNHHLNTKINHLPLTIYTLTEPISKHQNNWWNKDLTLSSKRNNKEKQKRQNPSVQSKVKCWEQLEKMIAWCHLTNLWAAFPPLKMGVHTKTGHLSISEAFYLRTDKSRSSNPYCELIVLSIESNFLLSTLQTLMPIMTNNISLNWRKWEPIIFRCIFKVYCAKIITEFAELGSF